MARVGVDISLFTIDANFGNISGAIDVAIIRQVGDTINFLFPKQGRPPAGIERFSGLIKVAERLISANGDEKILLSLEDITVDTTDEASLVMSFFEQSYGLLGDRHGSDE